MTIIEPPTEGVKSPPADDLTPSMCQTLRTLHACTTPGHRWVGVTGLNVHKSSIYALERRGFLIWDAFHARAALTADGMATFEARTQ